MCEFQYKAYYLIAALAFFVIGGGFSAYGGYTSGVDPLRPDTYMPLSAPANSHDVRAAWGFFIVNGLFSAILVTPIFWLVRSVEDGWKNVDLIIKIPVATMLIVLWVILIAVVYFVIFAR